MNPFSPHAERQENISNLDRLRAENHGKLPEYAWPGGYPIYYLDAAGLVLCPDCANKDGYDPAIAAEINYEGATLHCDDCGERIEAAYVDSQDSREGEEVSESEHPTEAQAQAVTVCAGCGDAKDNVDLFGHPIYDPIKGKQLPLFHEPNAPAPVSSPGEIEADRRIARKFADTPTAEMFPAKPEPKPAPRKPPLWQRIRAELDRRASPTWWSMRQSGRCSTRPRSTLAFIW